MPFDPNSLPIPDLGLRCLKCGYYLAGLPRRQCPECGRTFTMEEHIPPGDFPPLIFEGREVRAVPDTVNLMRRARIPFMEQVGPMESMYGLSDLPGSRRRLAVARGFYFQAIELLRRFHHHGELPEEPAAPPPDWTCPGCGETNPGTFEVCWNCSETPPP